MYTSPIRTVQPTAMEIAMIGRLTRANSRSRTWMCFRARISRHRRPARDALNAVLNAPKFTPIAMLYTVAQNVLSVIGIPFAS